MVSKLKSIWDQVLINLEPIVNDKAVFDNFISVSSLVSLDGNIATVSVPSKFSKEIIVHKYLELIDHELAKITETNYKCVIKEENELNVPVRGQFWGDDSNDSPLESTNLNPQYTFDSFVVGGYNKECYSAALTAATEPGKFYNPLFIYGKSGIGKTHLLHAIGNYVRLKQPRTFKILYTSSQDFMDDLHKSFKEQNATEKLKEKLKSIDVLLIDDIQFLSGNKASELFFQIFNHLINSRKQIVITSDRPPHELRGLEDRLVSRFASGLSVAIQSPEFDTSLKILKKKLEYLSLDENQIDEEVLNHIALKYSSDIRQLEGALNRLIYYAITFKQQDHIDMELAYEAFKGLAPTVSKRNEAVSIEKIKTIVADYYNLSTTQLTSKVRTNNIATARHIAMYLCRSILDVPFIQIGQEFGGRDHSTVINACEKIEKSLKTDDQYKKAIDELKFMLKTK